MAMPAFVTPLKPEKKPVLKVVEPKIEEKQVKHVEKPIVRLKDKFNKYHSPNSLGHLLKEEKKSDSDFESIDENKPATPFEVEQMAKHWKDYVSSHIDQKNRSLYAILNSRIPEVKDNFNLDFPVENTIQKQKIEAASLELVSYLRERLNNFSIVLRVMVKEGIKEKSYYTTEERYKYLADKYPIIEKLRKNLDLDIDY